MKTRILALLVTGLMIFAIAGSGDVNEDGATNVRDISAVELCVVEADYVARCDTNEDGVVNVLDITTVELLVAGVIE